MINMPSIIQAALFLVIVALPLKSYAVLIGGVEFPQGDISFADSVHSFTPNIESGQPTDPFLGADNALGAPDFSNTNCVSQIACEFVSLGDGGSIVLQFLDNLLTGSDNDDLDLWIFEIGPDVEDTFVEISVDGVNWLSVGAVGGATSGIDIDAFGFDSSFVFSYVKLIDDTDLGGQTGTTVGADIDAVGAISTVRATQVPSPAVSLLIVMGCIFLVRKHAVKA